MGGGHPVDVHGAGLEVPYEAFDLGASRVHTLELSPNGVSLAIATVLTDITPEMRIHREEAFGPVATLYRAADLDEAVEIANDSPFGLSSNVWTRDEADVDRFVRDLEAGGVYVNGMTASHPAFPFGGVKRSGYGRELSGHGIREFCNITTVWHGA